MNAKQNKRQRISRTAPCSLFLFRPCSACGNTLLTVRRMSCRAALSRGRMAGIRALAGDTTALIITISIIFTEEPYAKTRHWKCKINVCTVKKETALCENVLYSYFLYLWDAGTILDMADIKSLFVIAMELTSSTSFCDEE